MDAVLTLSTNETETEPESVVPWPNLFPDLPAWAIDLLAIVFVALLAWVSARLLVRLSGRRIAKYFQRPSLTRVTLGLIRATVYLIALLIILRISGLGFGDLVLSVTVISAVVGVILAPIVRSTVSGVFLLADQPYEIGDMVELVDEEKRGFVDDITLRYTKIFTLDNTFLVVPNGEIRERDVINYSAEDSRTRLSLNVLVTYESNIPEARRKIEESAREVEDVIPGGPAIRIGGARYPASPDCLIAEFADDGVLLQLRYWVREPYRIQSVQSRVQTNIFEAFASDEIEFAYPHSHLIFDETSGEAAVSVRDGTQSENPLVADDSESDIKSGDATDIKSGDATETSTENASDSPDSE